MGCDSIDVLVCAAVVAAPAPLPQSGNSGQSDSSCAANPGWTLESDDAMRQLFILFGAIALGSDLLCGQQDAAQAFRAGKTAFATGNFERARELFERASRTDRENAEVFLWLGRARYQLGDLDAALGAWRRTLTLAPDEPFAKRMVAALRKRDLDTDRRLGLIDALLRHGLLDAARAECRTVRDQVALDAAQRFRLMLLTARVELERGDPRAPRHP